MNLNHLYYFKVLAQYEHYTQAAEVLNITQPSLTHAIKSIEDELGIYLFEKQGRNVKLTKYGREYYQYISKGLEDIEQGKQYIYKVTHQGVIDIAFIYTLGAHFIPNLINEYYQDHKDLQFNFKQGNTKDILEGLKQEKYDIAFCSYDKSSCDIEFTPIYKEELVLVVSNEHNLSSLDTIDIESISHEQLIYYDSRSGMKPIIDDMFHSHNILPHIKCYVEEDNAVLGLVSINYGIAIIPDIPSIKDYPVKKIKINNINQQRLIYLAILKNHYLSKPVKEFYNYVVTKKLK